MTVNNSSPYGGFTRFNPTQQFGDNEPVDAAHARDLFTNLEALNQAACQVRIGTSILPTPALDKDLVVRGDGADAYVLAQSFTFPLKQLKDGTLSPLYVKITAGNVEANETVYYYVQLRRSDVPPVFSAGASGMDFMATSIATTTPTVLTFSTNPDNVMYIPGTRQRRPKAIPSPIANHAPTLDTLALEHECCLDIWYRVPATSVNADGGAIYAVWAREIPFRTAL